MKIAILGSGFIARFYAESLNAQRRRDTMSTVYSRNIENAERFARDYGVQHYTNDMNEAINNSDVDVVIIALSNDMHETAVSNCAGAKKHVLCTKPLGRTAAEAKRMLDMAEEAGIFAGYLEDLCYTPKFLKSMDSIEQGNIGRILWTKSREAHSGPHSAWFWDKKLSGGGAIIDLACHCVEIGRNFIGKEVRPLEVMCWSDTQVHPVDAEDNAIGLVKYENGAIGQFEVSWTFKGGMDLRDEVMGTEGSIWINNFLRTGFEMFTTNNQDEYVAEKVEINKGWLFPVGDEAHELGYPNMFTDMFDAIEYKRNPKESFYDGYIVNAILDAAFLAAETKKWEPVVIEDWRSEVMDDDNENFKSFDDENYLIKEEVLPNGDRKRLLKNKKTGKILQRVN